MPSTLFDMNETYYYYYYLSAQIDWRAIPSRMNSLNFQVYAWRKRGIAIPTIAIVARVANGSELTAISLVQN